MLQEGVPHVSTFSGPQGNCARATLFADGRVRLDNTKGASFGQTSYSKDEWKAFIEGVKNGEFDVA